MTIPTDLPARLAQRTAEVQAQLDAIPNEQDRPLSMTRGESHALDASRAELTHRLRGLRAAASSMAEFDDIEQDERWIKMAEFTWRPICCSELLALKSPIRDRETKHRSENLTFSIRLIDRGLGYSTLGMIVDLSCLRLGELMAAAGYAVTGDALRGPNGWRGDLTTVAKRIQERTEKRDQLLTTIEDLLLSDADRIAREEQTAQHRAILSNLIIRNGEDGRTLVYTDGDGEPLPKAQMTPAQLVAVEWLEASQRG
jgi:hypothetical protein